MKRWSGEMTESKEGSRMKRPLSRGFYVSLAVMMTGAVFLGVFIGMAVSNPRIPKTEEMESAAIRCRNLFSTTDGSENLSIDVHSQDGLSAAGKLERLAQQYNGEKKCFCVTWTLQITYQLKNGKSLTRTYKGNTGREELKAVILAIPEADVPSKG